MLSVDADDLLNHKCKTFDKSLFNLPNPNYIEDVLQNSNRSPQVLRNFASIFNHSRLVGTSNLTILPVKQYIEHTACASIARNPVYFNSENIIKLAIKGGSNAVSTTFGNLDLDQQEKFGI